MDFQISKEPKTGKARVLRVNHVNADIGYQVDLVDTDGSIIHEGKEVSFGTGNRPGHMHTAEISETDQAARELLKEKIETAFEEYFNGTLSA